MIGTSARQARSQKRIPLVAPDGAELDSVDLAVLRLLAEDATRTIQDIAQSINLSHSAATQRLRRLEASGAIVARIALIEEEIFEPWVMVWADLFLTAKGRRSRIALYAAFAESVEILEAHEVIGDADLNIRAALPSAAHWPALQHQLDPTGRLIAQTRVRIIGRTLKRLTPHPRLADVSPKAKDVGQANAFG